MSRVIIFVLIVCCIFLVFRMRGHEITGGNNKKHKPDEYKDLNAYPASRFETYCRDRIQRLTGKPFPTVYPGWLTYRGRKLELDGYNSELHLAFECQGPQHTNFTRMDPRLDLYKRRVENDKAKVELCDKHGVGLIVIDYIIPKHLMGSYIRSRIYDISQKWMTTGYADRSARLGPLAHLAGDYIAVISHKASNGSIPYP